VKVDFKPNVMTIAVDSGSVVVDYSIVLETESFDGVLGDGQGSVFNADIEEAVEKLSSLVVDQLRTMSGLTTAETPLETPLEGFEEEDEHEEPL